MRFLVDAQLLPALASWLREQGLPADHVADLGMTGASDSDLADLAERMNLVIDSKDIDFVTLRLPDRFGLVWLRCSNATNPRLSAWLWSRWPVVASLLAAGERFVEVR